MILIKVSFDFVIGDKSYHKTRRLSNMGSEHPVYNDSYLFQGGQHTSSTRNPHVFFFVPVSVHRSERRDTKRQIDIPGEKANDNPFV
jgi:hypothetical protein